jgi:hypothetical protein
LRSKLAEKVKRDRERRKKGNTPCALRAKRGMENPSTSISISTPKMEKGVYKEGTWSQGKKCHPPTPIDRPLLCHQLSPFSPPTPKNTQVEEQENIEHDDQAAGEEQGCDELKHKICLQPSPHLYFFCSLKLSVKNSQASSSVFLVICVVVSGSYF